LRDEALYRNYGDVTDTSISELQDKCREIEEKISLVKYYSEGET
jgi:hypothetical protein